MAVGEVEIKPQEGFFRKMGLKNVEVNKIIFSERSKYMKFVCSLSSIDNIDELDIIYNEIRKTFPHGLEIDFKITFSNNEITKEQLIKIVEKSINRLKEKNAISKSFLYLYKIKITDNIINIILVEDSAVDILKSSNIDTKLEDILGNFGIYNFKIKFIAGDFSEQLNELEEKKQQEIITLSEKFDLENQKTSELKAKNPEPQKTNNFAGGGFTKSGYSSNKTKEIKGKSITLEEFFELYDDETAIVEGEIFSIDSRDIKNEKILLTLRITDNNTSLTTKIFCDKKNPIDVSVGDFVKISGKKQTDKFSDNEEILMINTINKIEVEKKKKIDTSEVKMVELHTHNKMSEMVGVTDVTDLVKQAVEFGHKAIAITDYSVVHAFPFAYKAAKGKDIKIILGCEMYMVDDEAVMVQNATDNKIEDEYFVVFDIETFGLNSHENEIIEIGAVKLQGNRIVDRYSQLINPNKPIPKKIQELTNITQDMVDGMPTIEEVLPKFLEFVGDATLVAHNAPFDIGFIKRDAKKILGIDYNPKLIDSLQMARDLYPELKKYGLKNLNKYFGLSLENHHRAVDDSQATANMFIIFLEKYLDKGITTLKEMNGAFPINIKSQNTNNIMLLAKTREGLKNLYTLVSKAHLEGYGNKKPRILKSWLKEYRDGLIVGSSLTVHNVNDGELSNYYMRYNLEAIEKNIDFYDYIELLPKSAYNELLEEDGTGTISSHTMIEDMNRYFYNLAKSKNILVTASSNIHYLSPEEHKIRAILLYGTGEVYRYNQYRVDNGFYFRTTDELLEEFNYLGEDIAKEIVVTNTNAISSNIESIKPVPDGFYPPKIENAENIVREMTYEKAYKIYGNPLPEIVEARLERELNAIIGNGFSVLYLSAQKLVKKSLDNGYLVGSRGSVGSSLVAFMMGITEVNALYPHYICTNPECKNSEFIIREGVGIDLEEKNCPKCNQKYKRDGYSIPFEVFMGFNGDKVPDIDLNFSGEYQSEIHRYCEELFGKENVFKAGTISTLAEKNAIGFVKKFFEEHELKYNSAELVRLGKKCEGAKRTTGQHPGGMIVVPREHSIYEFCPVQKPANDELNDSITTHFDYHVMDEQLVKLDILGHDDPTTIKLLQEYTGLDIYSIPLSDPDTLKIFSGTESLGITPEDINSVVGTFGVPEFGTPFVRQMLIDTMPKTFAELVRISGLSHGTDVWLNNAQEFIRAKEATLSEVITVRDDIMNYLIDQGIEKGTAFKIMEFVRKGQPTKNPDGWKEYSDLMKKHKVKDWYIESCRRIKYMFPKGHAVAYVMMAMRIAYFKVHYPLAFYAAYLSRKAGDFDYEIMGNPESAKSHLEILNKEPKLDVKKKAEMAVCEIVVEMYARGIKFLPIDVYKSGGDKFIIEDDKIRVPLIGISGLGSSVIENILSEREKATFLSYEDFKRRTKVSQTTLDKLKLLGAIENLSDTNQIALF